MRIGIVAASTLIAFVWNTAARAVDWWAVPFGNNAGAITALYIDKDGLTDSATGKYAWIVELIDPHWSRVAMKKERIDVDCTRSRYRGVQWTWTDQDGDITTSDEEDQRWSVVFSGTPMESARNFACTGMAAGATQVQAVPH